MKTHYFRKAVSSLIKCSQDKIDVFLFNAKKWDVPSINDDTSHFLF